MPPDTAFSWDTFRQVPVIAILRGYSPEVCREIAEVGMDTGFHTLEVTMNTEEAVDILSMLRRDYPLMNVGAGTVCTLEDYEEAVAAGAQFIVMPIVEEEVIVSAVAEGLPVFPGAYTPTEIYRAWSLGATAVKVFPARELGPEFVRDIHGPLSEIKLLPTGGVDKGNIRSYFEAGVLGVGMASGLLDRALLAEKDYDGLSAHFRKVKNAFTDVLE
ncbi:2-dehydro-3-deoxyphosphogluconate aldolase/(4S)-4-hydroxy-2-oxoglutarate aldolase [Neolewinella xylanilytica]|uniref:2-dehydro-3-deoxyphosphogluconate aldolase/(4S)-4-hydroxy-2-oxoglutarate aldolase n=1 Tax=Neolewinella xylanilytica TaxID=1514080 RepID=A0A2S6I1H7_9BACT|nr:bifunctional 4-hydroxy-2-oxoglutarate aldolase/2-dehydro-3-deoxy-phosphogluconate aldolase [Neolewinella xylanilytica]PPK85028.1 2-dehydro-3-deoxyphosphogluconate aldolase/(4S)-4-hydroxy-2-oxoglutarate aldolase [Neolewinella xylanilytica]